MTSLPKNVRSSRVGSKTRTGTPFAFTRFMMPWTDFVMAKMILNSGVSADWTVAIGLYNMLSRTLVNNYFALFCAGGVLVSIPISVLFVIMQKFYVEGITSGADKG